MSIVLRQEKAKAWLEAKLREFDIESIMPGTKPNARVFFNYGPILFGTNGEKLPNSFLCCVLAKLTKDYPSEMLAAALAMGVKPIDAKNGPAFIPHLLIFGTLLKDVEPDGKRTIWELCADAIEETLPHTPTREQREKTAERLMRENPNMTCRELAKRLKTSRGTAWNTGAWQKRHPKKKAEFEAVADKKGRELTEAEELTKLKEEQARDDNSDYVQ